MLSGIVPNYSTESLLLLELLELPLTSSSELDELELSSLLDSLSLFLDFRLRDFSFDCAIFFARLFLVRVEMNLSRAQKIGGALYIRGRVFVRLL